MAKHIVVTALADANGTIMHHVGTEVSDDVLNSPIGKANGWSERVADSRSSAGRQAREAAELASAPRTASANPRPGAKPEPGQSSRTETAQ